MIFLEQAENKRIQEMNLSWNQLCGKGTVGVLKALEVSIVGPRKTSAGYNSCYLAKNPKYQYGID